MSLCVTSEQSGVVWVCWCVCCTARGCVSSGSDGQWRWRWKQNVVGRVRVGAEQNGSTVVDTSSQVSAHPLHCFARQLDLHELVVLVHSPARS
jgi:hypothetical protein